MNPLKRFLAWITGPKSDLALFLVLIVLANLVGARAFFRLDLTARHSYSLSAASRETVKTLEQPLGMKVFFSEQLPAPYNSVSRYLDDLLSEYKGAANRQFTYEIFDMTKEENQQLASGYGLQMIQIQEVKDNEVGYKNVWMGLAIVYSDGIETLDGLTSTEGLEYRITTTIGKMISKANTLAGLSEKVRMTLYVSPALGNFGISGFDKVKSQVNSAWSRANAKNFERIEFTTVEPSSTADVDALSVRFGLPKISWGEPGTASSGAGVIGLVLEYGDRFRSVPLSVSRSLFGGFGVTGLDNLDAAIADNLEALMARSAKVGYVTGHGELSLEDAQTGAANFSSAVSDMYEFEDVNLQAADIPANIASVVINGPKGAFTETELFRLDQFVMRGGHVLLLLDPFQEIQDQQAAMYGAPPSYVPIDTGLERLLGAWGVTVGKNYVLDKTCYVARQQGSPDVPLYYVPLVGKAGMNPKSLPSKGLLDVLMLASAGVELAETLPAGVTALPLVTSSPESWLMTGNISLSPYAMQVPPADQMAAHDMAVLLEGKFPSAFTGVPEGFAKEEANAESPSQDPAAGPVASANFVSTGIQNGKVIVIGTSAITTASVMDANAQQPVAMFVRNAVDYINGNGDLIDMRTKGLSKNPLKASSATVKSLANVLNLYGLPALVAIAGLLAWRRRVARRNAIRARYSPNDSRETARVRKSAEETK